MKDNVLRGFKTLAVLCALLVLCSGCIYSRVRMPLDDNFDNTELGTKEGTSTCRSLCYLFAWGDAGTRAAAEDGKITVIKYADRETMVILFGLYTQMSTVVYGD